MRTFVEITGTLVTLVVTREPHLHRAASITDAMGHCPGSPGHGSTAPESITMPVFASSRMVARPLSYVLWSKTRSAWVRPEACAAARRRAASAAGKDAINVASGSPWDAISAATSS